jgi:two-component system cell cycle response regulator DivK
MTAAPLVLLVDDYPDALDLYGSYLLTKGYRVAEAEDGLVAIAKAIALRPSVIVTDLAMPTLDGWQATQRLKADPRTARIPVICLSAHDRAEERVRAFEAGCDAFLTKPRLPREIAAEIARVLRGTDEPGI